MDGRLSSPAQPVIRGLGHCGHHGLDLSPGEAAGEASRGQAPAQGHPLLPLCSAPAGLAAVLAAVIAQVSPAAGAAAIFVGPARPPATGFTLSRRLRTHTEATHLLPPRLREPAPLGSTAGTMETQPTLGTPVPSLDQNCLYTIALRHVPEIQGPVAPSCSPQGCKSDNRMAPRLSAQILPGARMLE